MRVLIKSTICSASQGLFDEETRDDEGEITTPRRKIQDAIKFPKDMSNVVFTPDLANRTLQIKIGNKTHVLPITDHAYSQRELK